MSQFAYLFCERQHIQSLNKLLRDFGYELIDAKNNQMESLLDNELVYLWLFCKKAEDEFGLGSGIYKIQTFEEMIEFYKSLHFEITEELVKKQRRA